MTGSNLSDGLLRPSGYLIPRVVDQLSFCYIHMARISQDRTGVLAEMDTEEGSRRAYLPTAALASLLLGPGVSITQAAVATLSRHGTSIIFVGEHGVRCYASIPGANDTSLLLTAARTVSHESLRLAAARRMYALRFGQDFPEDTTLEQLRGYEGSRMRATYQALAKKHRVNFRRQYTTGDFTAADPVNQALSSANACLYGVVGAVLSSLGVPHGLGIIHTGHRQSLVYDFADIYKAEVTLPVAFSCADADDPSNSARRALRRRMQLTRLIPRIVRDVHHVYHLGPAGSEVEPARLVALWDPADGEVVGGTNYATGNDYLPGDEPTGTDEW